MQDGDGDSPLVRGTVVEMLDRMLYLISHGCGNNKFKDKAFITACRSGKLEVVKELVEKHNVDPKGDNVSLLCIAGNFLRVVNIFGDFTLSRVLPRV